MPRCRILLGSALAGSLLIPGATAIAQSDSAPVALGAAEGYKGVCPGTTHAPPGAAKANGNTITWPGFQVLPSGGSRIFVQSTAPVGQRIERQPEKLIVHLGKAKLALSNNARPLITRFFNTPVEQAEIRVRKGQARLVLHMRAAAEPTLSAHVQEATGLHFLYVDFAPGQYFEAAQVNQNSPASDSVAPSTSARPTHLDGEVSGGSSASGGVTGQTHGQASGQISTEKGKAEAKGEVKTGASIGF